MIIRLLVVISIIITGIISYLTAYRIALKKSSDIKYKLNEEYDMFKDTSKENKQYPKEVAFQENIKNKFSYVYRTSQITDEEIIEYAKNIIENNYINHNLNTFNERNKTKSLIKK